MEKIISVKNVTFEYKNEDVGTVVLKDFSLDFEKGSFTAVLGHNGCGKSTLAKLLNGLEKPVSGEIVVDGMRTDDEEHYIDIKRTVGVVFQNPDNQLVATVVEEDVAFGLENLGVEQKEMVQRVEDALRAVGMSEFKTAVPSKLSGGQKQRVAIAGIIAMQPKCIVFDEPTAMLDPKGRKEVMDVILKLCKEENITVILITHYMNEAALADRIVVMDNGSVLLDGTPKNVFSNVELLKKSGLDIPQTTELAYKLKKHGIDLENGLIGIDETVEALTEAFREEK